MFDLLGKSDKGPRLTIKPLTKTDLVLLCPNLGRGEESLINPEDPTSDSILEGHAVISLPTAARVELLRIELIGKQNVYCDGRTDTYETLHSTVTLEEKELGGLLGPGDHIYAFSFVIPSNMAPTELCGYGRTYYRLRATALGLKKMNRPLTAEHEVTLVSNPSPIGSIAPGFALEREVEHDVMGLIGIALTSKSLIVAGYLSLSIVMPAILQKVRLESVRVTLYQEFSLKSLMDSDQHELNKTMALPIWSTKRSLGPIGDFDRDSSYELSKQLRLNPDSLIRPSTAKWSKTGIRITHMLAITISYTPLTEGVSQKTDELTVTSPATIASCCCMLAELQLPAYSEEADASPPLDRSSISLCTACLCKLAEGVDFRPEDYGVSEKDLKVAAQWKNRHTSSWKDDEEYERDLCQSLANLSGETVVEVEEQAFECDSQETL